MVGAVLDRAEDEFELGAELRDAGGGPGCVSFELFERLVNQRRRYSSGSWLCLLSGLRLLFARPCRRSGARPRSRSSALLTRRFGDCKLESVCRCSETSAKCSRRERVPFSEPHGVLEEAARVRRQRRYRGVLLSARLRASAGSLFRSRRPRAAPAASRLCRRASRVTRPDGARKSDLRGGVGSAGGSAGQASILCFCIPERRSARLGLGTNVRLAAQALRQVPQPAPRAA